MNDMDENKKKNKRKRINPVTYIYTYIPDQTITYTYIHLPTR